MSADFNKKKQNKKEKKLESEKQRIERRREYSLSSLILDIDL